MPRINDNAPVFSLRPVRPPRTVPGLRALEGVTVKLAGTVTDTRDTERERERETVLGTMFHNGV